MAPPRLTRPSTPSLTHSSPALALLPPATPCLALHPTPTPDARACWPAAPRAARVHERGRVRGRRAARRRAAGADLHELCLPHARPLRRRRARAPHRESHDHNNCLRWQGFTGGYIAGCTCNANLSSGIDRAVAVWARYRAVSTLRLHRPARGSVCMVCVRPARACFGAVAPSRHIVRDIAVKRGNMMREFIRGAARASAAGLHRL